MPTAVRRERLCEMNTTEAAYSIIVRYVPGEGWYALAFIGDSEIRRYGPTMQKPTMARLRKIQYEACSLNGCTVMFED